VRENYYILLELDPSVRDEIKVIAAIDAKQQQWSKEKNHPTKGNASQKNLGLLPDIRKTLLNPSYRDAEAKAAQKNLLDEKVKNEKILKTAASVFVKNGSIKKDDLEKLAKNYNFTEDEVVLILKVRVIGKDDGIGMLDESFMKRIRSDLKVIGKKDLFDFLGLKPNASYMDLVQRATDIYDKYSKNANKTAEVTATVSLSSICKDNLKQAGDKEKYLKSLHYEYFGELKDMIDLWSSKSSIDTAGYQTLVSLAKDKEIPLERADFFIYDHCRKKGVEIDMDIPNAVPVPPTPPPLYSFKEKKYCRECGTEYYKTHSKYCINCGHERT